MLGFMRISMNSAYFFPRASIFDRKIGGQLAATIIVNYCFFQFIRAESLDEDSRGMEKTMKIMKKM